MATLQITFVGLFVFTTRGGVTHVLAPATKGLTMSSHGADGVQRDADRAPVEEHQAWLFLGPATVDDRSTAVPPGIRLDSHILAIRHEPGAGQTSTADDRPPAVEGERCQAPPLFDLKRVTKKGICPDVFGPKPNAERLTARADLSLGQPVEPFGSVGEYTLKDGTQPSEPEISFEMASYARVRANLPPGELHLSVTAFGGRDPIEIVLRNSDDPTERIDLAIYHVVPGELPPAKPTTARNDQPIHHWKAHYRLFDGPAGSPDLIFVKTTCGEFRGLTPNTCPPAEA